MLFYKNYFSFEQIMTKKMTWNDISIKKYLEIQEVVNDEAINGEDMQDMIANIIYDEDITILPIVEYKQRLQKLAFINTPPENAKLTNSYKIKDTKYIVKGDLGVIQANQFIDFQNYAKNKDIIGCISCFFIPEGHKYGDGGYDILKVKEDIGELPITVANALAFFFKRQYVTLLVLSSRSSMQKMKEMGMSKEKLDEMAGHLATLGIANLVSSHIY